ncbi:hypothetical protein PBF_01935 [Cytobacillus firmus DS1]|uniref:Uncharacterized protein n=1 Tax=Cytobacillus firmus DS1 TaxID=1307436 RepID=W7LLV1_CYTFI|nr:hypothetical protein PBF_01935 [Cytobacillus firmus DS1]
MLVGGDQGACAFLIQAHFLFDWGFVHAKTSTGTYSILSMRKEVDICREIGEEDSRLMQMKLKSEPKELL